MNPARRGAAATTPAGRENAAPGPRRPRTSRSALAPLEPAEELRCGCGRLLARMLGPAIELKCARCKRVVVVVDGRRFEPAGAGRCECSRDRAGDEE